MSKKKNGGGSRRPPGDYTVGYGKPPKGSQFPPGRSGNPNGRPRKTEPTFDEELLAMMEQPIPINEQGQRRVVPYRQALVRTLCAKALNDSKAAFALLRYLDSGSRNGSKSLGEHPMEDEDKDILERWDRRQGRKSRRLQDEGEQDD